MVAANAMEVSIENENSRLVNEVLGVKMPECQYCGFGHTNGQVVEMEREEEKTMTTTMVQEGKREEEKFDSTMVVGMEVFRVVWRFLWDLLFCIF